MKQSRRKHSPSFKPRVTLAPGLDVRYAPERHAVFLLSESTHEDLPEVLPPLTYDSTKPPTGQTW